MVAGGLEVWSCRWRRQSTDWEESNRPQRPAREAHMTKERSKPYNVELLKLAVPVATAIFVALLTGWTGYAYSQLTQSQNAIIAKRTELYDKIVKNTNAILSYYMFVGKWKRYTPL